MLVLVIVFALFFTGLHEATARGLDDEALIARTKTCFVSQQEAGAVKAALEKFYLACGFFPDQLDQLLEPPSEQQDCRSGEKNAFLPATWVNKELLKKFTYTPFGYNDYELSTRLFWTQDQ